MAVIGCTISPESWHPWKEQNITVFKLQIKINLFDNANNSSWSPLEVAKSVDNSLFSIIYLHFSYLTEQYSGPLGLSNVYAFERTLCSWGV